MTIEAVRCTHPGCVDLRDVRYPDDDVLHLTAAEWTKFLEAAQAWGLRRVDQTGGDHLRTPSLVCTHRSDVVAYQATTGSAITFSDDQPKRARVPSGGSSVADASFIADNATRRRLRRCQANQSPRLTREM
jgi:hypothetical protein